MSLIKKYLFILTDMCGNFSDSILYSMVTYTTVSILIKPPIWSYIDQAYLVVGEKCETDADNSKMILIFNLQ